MAQDGASSSRTPQPAPNLGALLASYPGAGGGAATSSGSSDFDWSHVYWGQGPQTTSHVSDSGGWSENFTSMHDSTDQGQKGLSMLGSASQRKSILAQLVALGLAPKGTMLSDQNIDEIWKTAMDISSREYGFGNRLTPWDVLKKMASAQSAARRGSAAFTGTKTSTSTNRNLQLTDAKTVGAMADAILQQELGRDATKAEKAQFVKTLNDAERKNPTVSTTTSSTRYKAGEAVSQSSTTTTKGGLDGAGKQELLQDQTDTGVLRQERDAQRNARYVSVLEQMVGRVGEAVG